LPRTNTLPDRRHEKQVFVSGFFASYPTGYEVVFCVSSALCSITFILKKLLSMATESQPANLNIASDDRVRFLSGVGAELRKARERSGKTISELHRETGISRTVLQGYEASRFAPGAAELKRVCKALNVSPNLVIFGEENPLDEKPLLSAYVGDMSHSMGPTRLALVLHLLSAAELTAILNLVESILISRAGGVQKLKQTLELLGFALDSPAMAEIAAGMVEGLNQKMDAGDFAPFIQKLEAATEEAAAEPKPKKRRKPVQQDLKL
jgi:transcriptional regulator with XRE-family HTH domain